MLMRVNSKTRMRQFVAVVVVLSTVFGAVSPAVAGTPGGSAEQVVPASGPSAFDPGSSAVAPNSSEADLDDRNETSGSNVTPGQQLSGVIGVQSSELESEVTEREFAVRVNRSKRASGKAALVADRVEELSEQVDRLKERRDRLREALRNDSISSGEFRAKMAILAANLSSTIRLINASESVSKGLPERVLRQKGINVSNIDRLRNVASDLTGREVSEIAREIGGSQTGQSIGGPSPWAGPPNRSGSDGDDDDTTGEGDGGDDGDDTPGEGDDTPGEGDGGDGSDNTPGEGNGSDDGDDTPGEGDGSDSGDGGDNTPGEGNGSDDGDDTPGEGDGSDDTPGKGDGSDGSDGSDDTPGEGDGGDGSDDTPGEGDGGDDNPGKGDDAPGEGDGSDGSDGSDDTPGEGDGSDGASRTRGTAGPTRYEDVTITVGELSTWS